MKEKVEKEVEHIESIKCSRCNKNDAAELHTCPFAEDVNNDTETLCDCCEECTHECEMDI